MLFLAGSAVVYNGTCPTGESTFAVSKGHDPLADFEEWFRHVTQSIMDSQYYVRGVQMGQFPYGGEYLLKEVYSKGNGREAVVAAVENLLLQNRLDAVYISQGPRENEFHALFFHW